MCLFLRLQPYNLEANDPTVLADEKICVQIAIQLWGGG